MITTIFSKSRPFNYVIVIVMLIICFILIEVFSLEDSFTPALLLKKSGILMVLVTSLFLANFITYHNDLSRNSTYSILFYFLFLIIFPDVLVNYNLVIANFLILLALRRLFSIQSLLKPKEKIFDASLLIFTASLFHFWSVLFILLVFVSIVLHVSRDYRNWIIPYIALFTVAVIFLLIASVLSEPLIVDFFPNPSLMADFIAKIEIDFSFTYFKDQSENIAFSIYVMIACLFFFSQLLSYSKKPLMLHATYKKAIIGFIIGIVILIISPDKSNGVLIYTFLPLSLMATSYIESLEIRWMKEATTLLIIGLVFLSFFLQL